MFRTGAWLIGMVLFAAAAGADDKMSPLSTLATGDRVRVKVVGNRETLTSTIDSVTADELVLSATGAGQPLRLSLGQLDRIDVSRGQRSQWRKGAVIGLIPGAAFGGLVGVALACDPDIAGCDDAAAPALAAGLFGAVVFGAATASVGALIGLAFKTDHWVRVHEGKPKASLILAPTDGGMRVGLSVSF